MARILVVEDESIVAEDIQDTLSALGHAIAGVATSGKEAVQRVGDARPDLVLMDIVLQGDVDGVEAAEKIRTRYNIPVVFLTAYSDDKTLQRAMLTEPFGYILKPFAERELHTTIEVALYKHKMESRLRESERWLATTLQSIGDAVIATDSKGHVKLMNPVAEMLTGWKQEEAVKKDVNHVLSLVLEGTRQPVDSPITQVLREGAVVGLSNHTVLVTKGGAEVPIDDCAAPIRDDKGRIAGAVLVFRDMTERRRSEQAIRDSEQRYRALFEESKDTIVVVTLDGKLLDINPAGIEAFGYASKEEILQVDIPRDLYANPSDRKSLLQTLVAQGFVKDYELALKRKDGEPLFMRETATAIRDPKGAVIAYRGILRDVTESRRLEQQLLHAQKVEAVGQLAGGIAHDFNNILTTIIGYADILRSRMGEHDALRDYVKEIFVSAERAAKLTQGLLAFSRKQIIKQRPVSLNEIVRRVVDLISRLISENIELRLDLADRELTVEADSGQIEQVLMNLCVNARDAMPAGGVLTVTTDVAAQCLAEGDPHSSEKGKRWAMVAVADTGIGMDDKIKERLFEPYFTTKGVGKGTGLGLSVAYGIVKQHDGHIEVQSEVGRGSLFKVCLPMTDLPSEKTRIRETTTPPRGGDETVLVAEDDERVRKLVCEVLHRGGYEVVEAIDGDDAVVKFVQHRDRIRMVVLDVIMPGKNGREVYGAIRSLGADVKTLFVSGYTADVMRDRKISDEELDFISKPVAPDELLRKVRELLDARPPSHGVRL